LFVQIQLLNNLLNHRKLLDVNITFDYENLI
jgi:hypothetical protein